MGSGCKRGPFWRTAEEARNDVRKAIGKEGDSVVVRLDERLN
jgi:ribosomal protein L31E